jgi:hypothetical protein
MDVCEIGDLVPRYGAGEWRPCMAPGKEDKEYCLLVGVETRSDQGWTPLRCVIRHALAPHKRMFRICTRSAVVDVTDDHSLLRPDGQEVSPKDVRIGTRLMHKPLPVIDGLDSTDTVFNRYFSAQIEAAKAMCKLQGESMIAKYSGDLLSSAEVFKLLLRLRQISVHPQVYINAKRREDPLYSRKNWSAVSTKVERVKNIIRQDSTEKVHKYIIFCQFIDEMALIREALLSQVKSENILMYHGGMNQAERTAVLAKSKKTTETTVMLLQLHAGGVGLNLQEYDRIIFVSPWWTAALMDQAIARAIRMGQTEVVKVYHLRLAAEDGATINIDNMVDAKAVEKRKMLEKLFALCE